MNFVTAGTGLATNGYISVDPNRDPDYGIFTTDQLPRQRFALSECLYFV